MVELFEGDIKNNELKSSKGNQLKWENNSIWYKVDYTGYEGLSEYVISNLLLYSNLKKDEFVLYTPETIVYKTQKYNGVKSNNFLKDDSQIITLERLFKNYFNQGLNKSIWSINNLQERLRFLVENVERITKIEKFGEYMNQILTIDAFFLNDDRHTNNLAVLLNGHDYAKCPIFDNGAGLLADTTMDYPLSGDIYKLIASVKGKTFSTSLDEQLEVSELLYGENLKFSFSKHDVDIILNSNEALIYPTEIRERVKNILFEQMRKYRYLFK